jgi:hypothetical protein
VGPVFGVPVFEMQVFEMPGHDVSSSSHRGLDQARHA